MSKILLMTQNFYPVIGSSGNRNKNLFELLNQNGIDTTVLTTEPAYPNKNLYKQKEFWDEEHLNENEKIIRLPLKSKKYENTMFGRLMFYLEISWAFTKKAFKLRQQKYDYILVSSPPIFIVPVAFFAKRLYKAKLILEIRDLWPDSLSGVRKFNNRFIMSIFKRFEKRMYNKADAIIINSPGFRTHIEQKLKDKNKTIAYLPNGARKYEIVENRSLSHESAFRVVYAGNLGLAQDIESLMKIAKKLNDNQIHFEVIGYGARAKDFEHFIMENNLHYVHLHKPASRNVTLDLISNSDIAIALLNDEDVFSTVLPGKIIDYITCGTPVVAAVKGQAAQLIEKNKVGFVFNNEAIDSIVNKIIFLKENKEIRQELEGNCSRLIEEKFLWEKNIKQILPLFSE